MKLNKYYLPLLLLISAPSTLVSENNSSKLHIPSAAETENFRTSFTKGCKLYQEHKLEDAIAEYKKTVQLNPECYQAYLNMGICFHDLEQWYKSRDTLEKAISLKPDYAKAHFYLGKIMAKLGRMNDALSHYQITIEHDPKYIDAYLERARIFKDQHQFPQALQAVEDGLRKDPQHIHLLFEKANILNTVNDIEGSLTIYQQLLEKMPNSRSLLYNTGYTLKKLGKNKEARPYYDKLLTLYPDHVEGHFGYGLLCLSNGEFKSGWKEYEWRWQRADQQMSKRYTEFPAWDGSDLHGKVILLYGEQGLGDTYQFIRFASYAKKMGGYVIVAVQSPLVAIASNCPYIDQVIKIGQTPSLVDFQAPLMSIPYILGLELEDIPFCDEPYLFANKELEAYWKEQLAQDTNFKIGICWQGNSEYSTPFLRAVVKQKSIPLSLIIQLADIPGVTLYNLQRQTGTEQITEEHKSKMVMFEGDFDNSNGRFMDTAAVINNMDLIISVDTSMCHISAGLCKTPVWNILPNPADWRWMTNQLDTPWYKTMRLFRQQTPGDWQGLLDQVKEALIPLVEEKTGKTIILENNALQTSTETKTQPTKSSYEIVSLQQQLEKQIAHIAQKMNAKKAILAHLIDNAQESALFAETIKSWIALHQLHEQLLQQYQELG